MIVKQDAAAADKPTKHLFLIGYVQFENDR